VLDGIVQSGNPGLRMGVLYSGTSPDFCRFHGIPTDPEKALRCLIAGNAKPVDVVRIAYSDRSDGKRVAHFGCGCNVGMGAAVARFANQRRRLLGDALGTGLAVARAIMFAEPIDLDMEVDETKHSLARVNNLSILKNPYIASGLKLNVNLQVDDGRLMLVAVHGQSRLGLCRLLPGFYSGQASAAQAVFMQECSRITVRSTGAREIECDGDPRGYLPAALQVLPRALNLIGGCHG
jgi:diacylglycerol kinase (ATP)